jgi:hypothetical protein
MSARVNLLLFSSLLNKYAAAMKYIKSNTGRLLVSLTSNQYSMADSTGADPWILYLSRWTAIKKTWRGGIFQETWSSFGFGARRQHMVRITSASSFSRRTSSGAS